MLLLGLQRSPCYDFDRVQPQSSKMASGELVERSYSGFRSQRELHHSNSATRCFVALARYIVKSSFMGNLVVGRNPGGAMPMLAAVNTSCPLRLKGNISSFGYGR